MDLEKKKKKKLNFIIDLQQYNPYDALMVNSGNKKSRFFKFSGFSR